ncbi:Protein zer-1-like protein [Fragariocoptes setiger]|uniref:Protein zer-1-like protein n=1 Tax=Fragariocoptes setiger TaxID=1670756 RepID=A0ABQ7S7E7_9ACAR|nr:Protein zer-1-like protein [Fragariocoptes setiger]
MLSINESLASSQDSPDSLVLTCVKYIVTDSIPFAHYKIPREIGHLMLRVYREHRRNQQDLSRDACEQFFRQFNAENIPLSHVDFSDMPITDEFLADFLDQYKTTLIHLNISNCKRLTDVRLATQPTCLKTLILGDTVKQMMPPMFQYTSLKYNKAIFQDNMELRKLVVHNYQNPKCEFHGDVGIDNLLTPAMISTLQYLDLSGSNIGKGNALAKLESLKALILYDCIATRPEIFDNIACIKTLKVLDISQVSRSSNQTQISGEKCLSKYLRFLVDSLPNLVSLDISGTQLVCRKHNDIAGLKSRQTRPFEFLGLFHAGEDAAYRNNIPAITIAGDANEAQILTACEVYMHRKEQLGRALNDLFNCFRIRDVFEDIDRALNIVLSAMKMHLNDEQVQCTATASLFYIVKSSESSCYLGSRIKRLIIKRLLDTMLCHKHSKMVLRNGVLIMVNTNIQYLTFEYLRVSLITMHIINASFDDDGFMQRVAVFLLNSIACQTGGLQKVIIGTAGAVETMIDLIKSRLADGRCDDTLETAWSTLWNITDETPVNCERFLQNDGLETFTRCMDAFPDSNDLLRNIMGLLGNVAECENLRYTFMEVRFISRFNELLRSEIDGIECSYNACGILAHIMSDGSEFWERNLPQMPRQERLEDMRRAISRSFVPIMRLLEPNIAAEAQYWAVWALTNLTRVYPHKYCSRLIEDGGHERLKRLVDDPDTADYVRNLAKITLYQVKLFNEEKSLNGLENCDSIDYDEVVNFRVDSAPPVISQ